MEREIKFRGRTKDGRWLKGNLVQFEILTVITSAKDISKTPIDLIGVKLVQGIVEADTVGQWTGKTDKNKAEVYEGDFVEDANGRLYIVQWNDSICCMCLGDVPLEDIGWTKGLMNLELCEVVGNKWDNPELIKGYTN